MPYTLLIKQPLNKILTENTTDTPISMVVLITPSLRDPPTDTRELPHAASC